MIHDVIMGAINEALDSAEFRALLSRKLYEKIAPKIEQEGEATKETVAFHPRGVDASGCAWLFRQKLDRYPFSTESEHDLAGHMRDLVDKGATYDTIHMVLTRRGKSAETIFDFKKRVLALTVAKAKSVYDDLEAAMKKELARRSGSS